jgi:hypothetical protein
LHREDFHHCDITNPIDITLTFSDLQPEASEEFKGYVRQGRLVISAVAAWDENRQSAEVKQYGERLGIEDLRKYFEMEKSGSKAPELREYYASVLRNKFPGLQSASTKPQIEESIHTFEAAHPELCTLIRSEDQFYGVSRGTNRIEKFLQWIYVPAVKDASSEQVETRTSAIGKLLARRVHSQMSLDGPVEALKKDALAKYKEILDSHDQELRGLSDSLNKRFHQWANDRSWLILQWQDQEKAVNVAKPVAEIKAVEGLFKGDLARFGHGLQRSFIFALLQELSENADTGPRLLLGCEEPELYQHPPQVRHLTTVLQKLSTQNAQVVICTHSPYFVSGRSFENVRLSGKDSEGRVHITSATFDSVAKVIASVTGGVVAKSGGMAAKIEQDMESSMNEMFFATFRVFVEGLEDVAYISSYLTLKSLWDEFRGLGGHLIPVHGKSHLIQALAIANEFHLPCFSVFDCDGDTLADDPNDPSKQTGRRNQHERENKAIFSLAAVDQSNPFPDVPVVKGGIGAWPTKLSDVVEQEIGKERLTAIKGQVRLKYGINTYRMNKSNLFIGYVMAEAWDLGLSSPTLSNLCEAIVNYGRTITSNVPDESLKTVAAT